MTTVTYNHLDLSSRKSFAIRVSYFAEHLDSEESDNNLSFWDKFVAYFISRNLVTKMNTLNGKVDKEIMPFYDSILNQMTQEELIKEHSFIKSFLDIFHSKLNVEEILKENRTHFVIKPLYQPFKELMDKFKHLELKSRLKCYPEKNEIILSYDELLELNTIMSHWEPADEQSDAPKKDPSLAT